MATLQWCLTCRDIVVDKQSNNISYRDAIEEITPGELPSPLPPILIITMLWRRDDLDAPEHLETRVVVRDERGNQLGISTPEEVDLEDHPRFRAHIQNPVVNVQEAGTLWFVIEKREDSEWEEVTRLPLEVNPAFEERDVEAQSENGSPES